MIQQDPKQKFTVRQVAAKWAVSPETVRGWIHSGKLRAVSTSGIGAKRPTYRISADALAEFERRQLTPTVVKIPRRRRALDYKQIV